MEGLMYLCGNWGGEECHPDIRKFKYDNRVEPGEKLSVWPPLDVLSGLDEICKTCNFRYFNVKKKECPVCDSSDLTETKGGKFAYENGRKIEVSFLKCNQCGTDLRLTK